MPDTRTRYLADELRLHCVMPQTERKTLNLLSMDFHEEACQESGRCLRCDHFGFGSFRGGREKQW